MNVQELKLHSCVYEDSSLLGCCAVTIHQSTWHNIPQDFNSCNDYVKNFSK